MRLLAIVLLLACSVAHAQTAGEIAFWESVRDSKNATELRAYLERYPNGAFAPLAKARLAALEQKPAAAAPAAGAVPPRPASAAGLHVPQAGDTWTYGLNFPHQWGKPSRPPAKHVVTVQSASDSSIVDQLSVDGAAPISVTHTRERTLIAQGASVFSPYLLAFGTLPSGRLGAVAISDPGCSGFFVCEGKARVMGVEVVKVPAGTFAATKVIVDQEWRPASLNTAAAYRMTGGRRLTIWYSPEIGRAVKYESRSTVGDVPPIDPHFDLELVSYQLK